MNDKDSNNLSFMLSMEKAEFESWCRTISEDDIDYAIDLCKRAKAEVEAQESIDTTEANILLKKFML